MKPLRIAVIALLIFNAISALFGGIALIIDPSGDGIGMPLSLLQYSPFADFLIPGILLFIFNGCSSLWIAIAGIKKYRLFHWLVMAQGVASIIWIVTQVFLIQDIGILHYIYGGIGVLLLLAGIVLKRVVL